MIAFLSFLIAGEEIRWGERITGIGTTAGYLNIRAQLDQLYHDMKDGKLGVAATTGSWFVGISSVKTAIAKT